MDNTVIEIKDRNGRRAVSARELYKKLGAKSRFNDWFTRMCSYGFEEDIDYVLVTQKKVTNNPKNPEVEISDYFISLDMAKEICMIQRSKIGKKFRQYFIECEKELNSMNSLAPIGRTKSKQIRNMFTGMLHDHGYSKKHEYINTTKAMKKELGITEKKDDMSDRQLAMVGASEWLSMATIGDEFGYHEVNPVCVDASKTVAGFIENKRKEFLEKKETAERQLAAS